MERIIEFLTKNGYKEETERGAEYRSFFKDGLSSIDVNNDEIVFIGDKGDWLHIPVNYYALIGALLHHRQLATNYVA
jgi:hypothetical protein